MIRMAEDHSWRMEEFLLHPAEGTNLILWLRQPTLARLTMVPHAMLSSPTFGVFTTTHFTFSTAYEACR